MTPQNDNLYDVLIVGSGAAGLTSALNIDQRHRIAVLAKGPLSDGSTYYAQGGIAAALDSEDSIEAHLQDTLRTGGGIGDPDTARFTVSRGPEAIDWLTNMGAEFSINDEMEGSLQSGRNLPNYHLTREGAHSHRRVVHAADATGQVIENALLKRAEAAPNITLFEEQNAVDLIIASDGQGGQKCIGLYAFDCRTFRVNIFRAKAVLLATGGASKVYLYTSNPDGSTGDGIAMAWRAGCRVANMEFNQFHPTCLFHPEAKSFLISEAVRGEGGKLLLPDGSRFMDRFDKDAELASRDVVARAIDNEMKRLGADCLYLDISHRDPDFIKEHFPTIYARCLEYGIDMTAEPIPIVPAAHYTCGGVVTDHDGRADIPSLYVVGEAAHTGLHGANRLASNSLLECLVFGISAAQHINKWIGSAAAPSLCEPWDESRVTDSDEEVVVTHNWHELRQFMWDYVGIVRTDKRLQRAKRRVDLLLSEISEYYSHFRVTSDLLELRNLSVVADLIIRSAMERRESRGLHFTEDYPADLQATKGEPTILTPTAYAEKAA